MDRQQIQSLLWWKKTLPWNLIMWTNGDWLATLKGLLPWPEVFKEICSADFGNQSLSPDFDEFSTGFSRDFLGCFWIRGALLARRWTRSILAFLTTSVVGMVAGSYCKWTIVTPSNTNMEPTGRFSGSKFFVFSEELYNSGNLLRHLGRVIDRITRASILVDHHLSSQVSFQGENNYLCSKRDKN